MCRTPGDCTGMDSPFVGPFLGTEALAEGTVTRRKLSSRHEAVYRDVYLAKGTEMTAAKRALAAWLWSGRQATLTGLSASAVYGTQWIDPTAPAELYRRNGKPTTGILIHRDELHADETRRSSGDDARTYRFRPGPAAGSG